MAAACLWVSRGKSLGEKKLCVGNPTLLKRDVLGVFQDKRILGHSEHSVLQEWCKFSITQEYGINMA